MYLNTVYGDWSIWSRENTKGDHVIPFGRTKIRWIILTKVSVCTKCAGTFLTTPEPQIAHCLDIKMRAKMLTLLPHIAIIMLEQKQQNCVCPEF
jgi:hypothetical protein